MNSDAVLIFTRCIYTVLIFVLYIFVIIVAVLSTIGTIALRHTIKLKTVFEFMDS